MRWLGSYLESFDLLRSVQLVAAANAELVEIAAPVHQVTVGFGKRVKSCAPLTDAGVVVPIPCICIYKARWHCAHIHARGVCNTTP